jgi:hypothetical protein
MSLYKSVSMFLFDNEKEKDVAMVVTKGVF